MSSGVRESVAPAASNGHVSSAKGMGGTGIRVVIVGAGFAGLTAAIECTRKGHSCIVLESYKSTNVQLGDVISFGSNSGRIFQRWPGVPEKLDPISHKSPCIVYKTWKGEHIYTQWWGDEQANFGKRYNGHRGEFHRLEARLSRPIAYLDIA